MPIDLLGGFFPPPARPVPDRPHRVDKIGRDDPSGRDAESKAKRNPRSERKAADTGQHGHTGRRISVKA